MKNEEWPNPKTLNTGTTFNVQLHIQTKIQNIISGNKLDMEYLVNLVCELFLVSVKVLMSTGTHAAAGNHEFSLDQGDKTFLFRCVEKQMKSEKDLKFNSTINSR